MANLKRKCKRRWKIVSVHGMSIAYVSGWRGFRILLLGLAV